MLAVAVGVRSCLLLGEWQDLNPPPKEKETINVTLWAGIGAIVEGAVLFVLGGKGR
jgi:hypothetical protein